MANMHDEYKKCERDPVYFIKKYVKPELTPMQEALLRLSVDKPTSGYVESISIPRFRGKW